MPISSKPNRTRRRVVTVALIGTGRWGTNIKRTLEALPDCRLFHVETVEWRELLHAPDLDGVLIATPGSTHAAIALPFIQRGIATFIEKPLTTNLGDALALERAARRSRSLVFVGHVHLYNPAYLVAKKLASRAGTIRYIVAEGMNNGPFRDDLSALWDWAPHDIAMCLDLLGAVPTAIRAWALATLRPATRLSDLAVVELRFPGGTHAFLTESWLMPEKRKRLTIVGAKDTIVFDDIAERKVTWYREMGPRVRGRRVTRQEPRVVYPAVSREAPLAGELKAFLTAIRTGRTPRSSLTHGVATIRVLAAAERSAAHGGSWIAVPPRQSLQQKTPSGWLGA